MNLVDEAWMKLRPTSTSSLNEDLRQISLQYIHECFGEDSELARKLTPDFPFGGKRPVRDPGDFAQGGYYWALAQPHVDLVTSAIARVVPEGIVTTAGRLIELDAIIWATGMTFDWLSTIQTIGRGSVRLSQVWANNDPRSYLGGTVPGFPNLFINDGPNTGVATGGGGYNFMTETVNHYAFECLQLLVERGGTSIEVTQRAHDEHNELIEREMSKLLWSYERKASTYCRNEAGRVILPSPFRPETFWSMCQKPDETKFVIHNPAQIASVAYD
jgi:cation diffusion facilitator CzcD-associated flavoprotein CzcO